MQTALPLPLPWPSKSSTDKTIAEKVGLFQQKARQKPKIDIPQLFPSKRKRTDSVDAFPGNAPLIKKPNYESIGAVQPSLEPTRGADYPPNLEPTAAGAQSDEQIRGYFAVNHQASAGAIKAPEVLKMRHENLPVAPSSPTTQISSIVDASVSSAPMGATPLHQLNSATPAIATKPAAMTSSATSADQIRAVIEAQLDLEILHKHQELRLIEQEIAKCQIGLEQLRRCEVIPYPGSDRPSLAVSTGTGAALASPDGYTSPEYCAPWGVTDGPYSRHYAKWLLSDVRFDPMVHQSAVNTPLTARAARAARTSGGDTLLSAAPARHSRNSGGSRTSLPGDPSTPTAQRDPMIMKRQQDGQWVRLRCNNCHRSDFNNVQGFLNHCRIAHKEDFKSHEAAAIVCGEIVSIDESQYGAELAPVTRESHAKAVVAIVPSDQPLVSPLITNTPAHSPLDRVMTHPYTPDATPLPSPSNPTSFVKSSSMPHLSSLMARNGMSVAALEATAQENKKRHDLSIYDDSDSERDHTNTKHRKAKKPKPTTRHPSSGQYSLPTSSTLASTRPPSQKSSRAPPSTFSAYGPVHTQQPSFSTFSSRSSSGTFGSIAESPTDGDVDMGLSPGTADSNPGLVSDHEDDDDDVDEDARSASGSHTEAIMDGIAVEIEDASDVEAGGRKRVRVEGETPVCRSRAGVLGEGSD
jgi:ADA HAT complex component 1